MKKDLDLILKELVGDYKALRANFDELDAAQRDMAIQAMANTLV